MSSASDAMMTELDLPSAASSSQAGMGKGAQSGAAWARAAPGSGWDHDTGPE